jgi:peptidoglycan/xylan/chitin deacetylase (PgdA/CDA1 family)
MLGDLYYGTLRGLGITTLARRLQPGALVLCYHNVVARTNGEPAFGDPGLHLGLDRFTTQVQWLKAHYAVVPLRDLVTRLASGRPVRGLAAITFDDGYTGALTLAWPLLRKLGLPATMFVVGEAPGRSTAFWWDHPAIVDADTPVLRTGRLLALGGDHKLIMATAAAADTADIPATHLPGDWRLLKRAASDGLELGAHTLTHRTLTRLPDRDLRQEIEASRDVIEERGGVRPLAFSYPYGIWDRRVRGAVRQAGYLAAVTLDFGLNRRGTDPCALRRVNVPAAISVAAFASWAAGIRPPRANAA